MPSPQLFHEKLVLPLTCLCCCLIMDYLEVGEEVAEMGRIEKLVVHDSQTRSEKTTAASHCEDLVLV